MKHSKDIDKSISSFASIFSEEFDSELVVNRAKVADFLTEDSLPTNQKASEKSKLVYISKKDLATILAENPGISLLTKKSDGEYTELNDLLHFTETNSADSKDDLIEISIPEESIREEFEFNEFDYEDSKYNLSESELLELERKEKLKERLLDEKKKNEEEYISPQDELFNQRKKNFVDYVSANVISGNKVRRYSDTYIPEEFTAEVDTKKMEIVDLASLSGKEVKKTSVLINRDENNEIESLEVLCKCGERTLIKFDFEEDEQEEARIMTKNTLVVVDTLPDEPLNISEAKEQASNIRKQVLKEDEVVRDITNDFEKLNEDSEDLENFEENIK